MEITDSDLEKIVNLYKKTTERECYKIEIIDEKPDILDDKLGGIPFLPVGEKYPVDDKGRQIPLLLQVNLKNIDLPNFPKTGILEVFMDSDWPGTRVVKLFDEKLDYQKNLKIDLDSDYLFIENPMKIKLEKTFAYLNPNDFRHENVIYEICNTILGTNFSNFEEYYNQVDEDQIEKIDEAIYNLDTPLAMIGGYPDFTQTDPRFDNDEMSDMSECIFKIDSCLNENIVIGDMGIAFGLISKDDLASGNFENALIDFDCC